jgi:hypothetical protein
MRSVGSERWQLSSEALIGAFAALSALVTAVFAGLVSLRHARRYVATADVMELRAYRDAWIWAVRTIARLLSLLARHDIPEPAGLREELDQHQSYIDHPSTKESA